VTGRRRAVVVGASLAGVTAVDALRLRGFDGHLTLIGDEPHRAYSRPALSKGILTGAESAGSVLLPPVGPDVEVLSGVRATGLDLAGRRVRLAGGGRLPYDMLVIATGARARRLTPDGGEIVLRGLDDALALRDRLAAARSVLVVGGGFLGMEVASAAAERGVAATVVDVRPHLAALGPWPAQRFAAAARSRGVRLVVSPAGVRRLDGTAVALGSGATLTADLVVTAIGDRPEAGWLTGAALPGGLVVDSRCRVTDRVVAAGDVVAFPGTDGTPRRLPHWDAALAQARVAACALLDGDAAAPYTPDPYYWTEAFGLAVKVAGPLPVAGPPSAVEGSVAAGSFLARWDGPPRPTVVAVNHRISVGKLRRLARTDLPQPTTTR
jgi:3-phenylpropionate/trans-cinnamate dioxygenase ferredoxin reductase subunit